MKYLTDNELIPCGRYLLDPGFPMNEDELPEDMTDDEYAAWFTESWVSHDLPHGGVRLGPTLRTVKRPRMETPAAPARKDLQHQDAGPRGVRYPFGDPQ